MNKDVHLKDKMKQMFVDELMKRQDLSGTFEITEGKQPKFVE